MERKDSWLEDFQAGLRIMDGHGLTEGFGHLSVRFEDGTIAITPAMGPGMAAEKGSHVLFSNEGKRIDDTGMNAPLETPMHLAVYASRDDVGAICRTHSEYVVSFGVAGRELRMLHGFGLMLGDLAPFFPDGDLITNDIGGKSIVDTIGSCSALLLKGNGALCVGESIRQAVVRAIYLEEAAKIAIRTHPTEATVQWSEEQKRARCRWHDGETTRAWAYYTWRYSRKLS